VYPRPWAPNWAKRAQARADSRTYIVHPHRHLALLREGQTLWRSQLPHGSDNVVIHGNAIAFTAFVHTSPHPELWVAQIGRAEHLAARGEELEGWARGGGFFTQRGEELLLRRADGTLIRRLARVTNATYDPRTQTIVAITPAKRVVRTDGQRITPLADLRTAGFARHAWVGVLPGGLINVLAEQGLLLLLPDGSRYASTRATEITSGLMMLPGRRGVVFVVQQQGVDRVVVLRRGGHATRLLDERRAGPRGCGYWANLSLAGNDVLYWPSTGHALVSIDASGRTAPHDLWPVVRGLPGFRHTGRIFRAGWASAWNS
jgi:hypothetical protein